MSFVSTGKSYRSKSRSAEYFVNKCYWRYWQYQFICWGLEKRDRVEEKKVVLEKGEQQSKTCISMFLLQKRAITKVPSVLERTCKSIFSCKSALFHKYFTMPFLTPGGNTRILAEITMYMGILYRFLTIPDFKRRQSTAFERGTAVKLS